MILFPKFRWKYVRNIRISNEFTLQMQFAIISNNKNESANNFEFSMERNNKSINRNYRQRRILCFLLEFFFSPMMIGPI